MYPLEHPFLCNTLLYETATRSNSGNNFQPTPQVYLTKKLPFLFYYSFDAFWLITPALKMISPLEKSQPLYLKSIEGAEAVQLCAWPKTAVSKVSTGAFWSAVKTFGTNSAEKRLISNFSVMIDWTSRYLN